MEDKQLFSVQETAKRWGVSPFTIRRLIDSGELRSVTIAARRLVPISEIERCEGSRGLEDPNGVGLPAGL